MSGNFVNHSYGSVFTCLVGLVIFLLFFSCRKEEKVMVTVMPPIVNAEFQFRGFVTDEEEELVSEIHNFTRTVTRTDTLDGRPVYAYISNNQESLFYTDEAGTVLEKERTDLGARILKYGFAYRNPIVIYKWKTLLKMDEGVGTEWETHFDTTFTAINLKGESQEIRFINNGKARYDGFTETFVPESYANVRVLDANWYELSTRFINQTTGDTLFSTTGSAHQYFQPDNGAVKYITDFVKVEIDESAVPLRGTWELMRKQIPE